jgi:hypothetical protein
MIVSDHQYAGMPPTKRLQIAQRLKDIDRVADIVKQDIIEFLLWFENSAELLLVRESHRKLKGRISLLCDFDNLRTNVNAFAFSRLDNGQKIASAAPNREHSFLRLYQKTKKPI